MTVLTVVLQIVLIVGTIAGCYYIAKLWAEWPHDDER